MTIYVITKSGHLFEGTEAWRHVDDAKNRMRDIAKHLNSDFEETEDGGWVDDLSHSIFCTAVVVQ